VGFSSTRYTFDYQMGDVFWCTADCGWITGHTYLTYGPMLEGAKQVQSEDVTPTQGLAGQGRRVAASKFVRVLVGVWPVFCE